MTCDVCDEPANVAIVQPDVEHDPNMEGDIHTLCAYHLAQFAIDLLNQLRDDHGVDSNGKPYDAAALKTMTEVEKDVWDAWGDLGDEEVSPVKSIAAELDMTTTDVAAIVYPPERFGPWDDSQEPDL